MTMPMAERPRRQWGAEKPRPPLPAVQPAPSNAATWMGGFAIAITIVLAIAYLRQVFLTDLLTGAFRDSGYLAQSIAYLLVMGLLTFSASMYLIARQGAMYRLRDHRRVPRAEIDAHFAHSDASITVLIPSYREDPEVVRATMLSAALQEFPSMRIVLLLDDPPHPTDPDAIASLTACRALPDELTDLFREPSDRFSTTLAVLQAAQEKHQELTSQQLRDLALDFVWAADWLDFQSASYPRLSNEDDFVAEDVLGALANDFRETASALFAALDQKAAVPVRLGVQLARRLSWTFNVEMDSFERKSYAHLPHDANKAMNLNAYMGLMGGAYRKVETRMGTVLREVSGDQVAEADLIVPATDYVLTLDADSVLVREYCLRLVFHLELPGNERIAVIQTPYSAFRGAPTRLERIAGATTDTQFLVHQGLTYYGATFWVGANAIIRWPALQDIKVTTYEGGFPVHRFVQDRTVIEDTESSVDLAGHGWTLYNYPERLSYSATPPDFGSLVVQRARWANGGLLIMPKLFKARKAAKKAGEPMPHLSMLLRVNYMSSIAWASVGLVFLLVFPFNSHLLSALILMAAVPYFAAMAYDFRRMGYKGTDVFRVYAFNLILLPVNLAGTFKSLQQAASKEKIPFARTPKVRNRTAAPALYVVFAFVLAGFSFYRMQSALRTGMWTDAAFAGFNGILTAYAIVAFIGLRDSLIDVVVGMVNWVKVPVRTEATADATGSGPVQDWESVLYFGPGATEAGQGARGQAAHVTDRAPRGERRARVRTESEQAAGRRDAQTEATS